MGTYVPWKGSLQHWAPLSPLLETRYLFITCSVPCASCLVWLQRAPCPCLLSSLWRSTVVRDRCQHIQLFVDSGDQRSSLLALGTSTSHSWDTTTDRSSSLLPFLVLFPFLSVSLSAWWCLWFFSKSFCLSLVLYSPKSRQFTCSFLLPAFTSIRFGVLLFTF